MRRLNAINKNEKGFSKTVKPFTFTCPLTLSWRIEPPHVLSIDSCLELQCAPLSRTATLLWTSPFLLCAARLFLAGLSFSFPLGSMSEL